MGKEKILDDIARMAGGAISITGGMARNIREDIKTHVDDIVTRLELVPREDFDRLELVLNETRKLVNEQQKRITDLETQLNKDAKKASKSGKKS